MPGERGRGLYTFKGYRSKPIPPPSFKVTRIQENKNTKIQ